MDAQTVTTSTSDDLLSRICPDPELQGSLRKALSSYYAASQEKASAVEALSPRNRFGQRLHDESLTLPEEADKLGLFDGLQPSDKILAYLAFVMHDFGRFRETLEGRDTLKDQDKENHGTLGANDLAVSLLLRPVPEQLRMDLLSVISNHGYPTVDYTNLNSSATAVCSVIRDMSKVHQIANPSFLEPEGIYAQLVLHYGIEKDPTDPKKPGLFESSVRNHKDFKEAVLTGIRRALAGQEMTVVEDLDSDVQVAVYPVMNKIMNTTVKDEDLAKVVAGETLPKTAVAHSYPNYMLWQLALINGIEGESSQALVRNKALFESRVAFLEARANPNQDISALRTKLQAV